MMSTSSPRQSPIEKAKPKPKSPYSIKRLGTSQIYQVRNRETGQIHAYGTTLENAKHQVRLLETKSPRFM
jgi:hypothetical protein